MPWPARHALSDDGRHDSASPPPRKRSCVDGGVSQELQERLLQCRKSPRRLCWSKELVRIFDEAVRVTLDVSGPSGVTPKNLLLRMQELGVPRSLGMKLGNIKSKLQKYRIRNVMGLGEAHRRKNRKFDRHLRFDRGKGACKGKRSAVQQQEERQQHEREEVSESESHESEAWVSTEASAVSHTWARSRCSQRRASREAAQRLFQQMRDEGEEEECWEAETSTVRSGQKGRECARHCNMWEDQGLQQGNEMGTALVDQTSSGSCHPLPDQRHILLQEHSFPAPEAGDFLLEGKSVRHFFPSWDAPVCQQGSVVSSHSSTVSQQRDTAQWEPRMQLVQKEQFRKEGVGGGTVCAGGPPLVEAGPDDSSTMTTSASTRHNQSAGRQVTPPARLEGLDSLLGLLSAKMGCHLSGSAVDAERLCRALLNNGLPEQPRQHPGASPSRTPFAPDSSETPWPELPDPFPGELEGDPLSLSINSSPVGCLAVALDEENF